MTEDIDIKKLTDDAFMAIDALFTDEDDDIFSEEKDSKPDDFDLIQEYMLAIEWECSDKNIKKFIDLLNRITPQYSGKHNQDILKMLMSIVRYLEKSKDKALPETHHVMEFIVKTFKNINQHGMDEASIKQEKNNAYSKVLDLKSKIAKNKVETLQSVGETVQEQTELAQSAIPVPMAQQISDPIESSKTILSILTRLELCENRIASLDTQNTKLQQQVYDLTNLNNQTSEQLNHKINDLELKFADQITELSQITYSIPPESLKTSSEVKPDPSFSDKDLTDDDLRQYDDISFDGIDFEEISTDTEKTQQASEIKTDINEAALDEIDIGEIGLGEIDIDNNGQSEQPSRLEIDFEQLNPADSTEVTPDADTDVNIDNTIFDDLILKEESMVEEITLEDVEYEEITLDAIEYDDNISSETFNNDNPLPEFDENIEDQDVKTSKPDVKDENKQHPSVDRDLFDTASVTASVDTIQGTGNSNDVPKYVRCFKIENQPIALPDDKIYNIYKIPSKLTESINQMSSVSLGEFSSLFQSLSRNMKGHLKDVSSTVLKKMDVDVHLLTIQKVQYKIAILCSFNNKVSIIPVTDICDNRNHPTTGIKEGHNNFSDYNVNIVDMGLVPFVHLYKK
ncbi:MAG: hypothetical protein HQK73_09355 [Desulfamplus sp.]|nr:hypothetical protein [Desulfamplus sp.]MBF0411206.1 hypothetical protein [Desulfamplus sp.]